jgi:hypothetical protein
MKVMKGTKKKNELNSPPYGNWKVYSPDDILMFRCGNSKANWYLNRNLAEIIDPTTLRLKFKPKGLGNSGQEYHLAERKNICVICGINSNLTKHHVVPKQFRVYFPEHLKRFKAHDVLVACIDCHKKYERHSDEFKLELAKRYNTHVAGSSFYHGTIDKELMQAKRFISFYLRHREQCLKYGMDRPFRFVAEKYLNKSVLEATDEELEAVMEAVHLIRSENYIPFAKAIVDQLPDLPAFCVEWRQHFLKYAEPQFLPEHWNINSL